MRPLAVAVWGVETGGRGAERQAHVIDQCDDWECAQHEHGLAAIADLGQLGIAPPECGPDGRHIRTTEQDRAGTGPAAPAGRRLTRRARRGDRWVVAQLPGGAARLGKKGHAIAKANVDGVTRYQNRAGA